MLAKSFMCNVLKSLLNGLLIKMNFVLIIKNALFKPNLQNNTVYKPIH